MTAAGLAFLLGVVAAGLNYRRRDRALTAELIEAQRRVAAQAKLIDVQQGLIDGTIVLDVAS